MPPNYADENRAAAFARSLSPNLKPTYSLAGTVKYEIPCKDIELSTVFEKVEAAKREGLEVLDWGIHNASLEDVFISLATAAGA